MWVRGLKPTAEFDALGYEVAPYVGAWIETPPAVLLTSPFHVAPYVGAWIETRRNKYDDLGAMCRTLCGCVD